MKQKNTIFLIGLVFFLLFPGFVFGIQTEEVLGRKCRIEMKFVGINKTVKQQIQQARTTQDKVQTLIDGGVCEVFLVNKQGDTSYLVRDKTKINIHTYWLRISSKLSSLEAAKRSNFTTYFQNGVFKNTTNPSYECHPIPRDVADGYIEKAQIRLLGYLNQAQGAIVTKKTCPEETGIVVHTINQNDFFIIGAKITDEGPFLPSDLLKPRAEIKKSDVSYDEIKGMIATLNIGKAKKPADVIGKAIKLVMGIVGAIALVMFVYAGGLWMVAGGNAQQTTKAMKTMVWSVIGLIVILSSYSIVNVIFTNTF